MASYLILILLKLVSILCSNNITVRIKGEGEQSVIYGGWSSICYRLSNPPDEIYINNEKKETLDYKYNFELTENKVTFVWYNPLTTCHCLLFECSSIVEVD